MTRSILLPLLLAASAFGQVFESDVQPIFTRYCSTCHGTSSPKLGLNLLTAVSVLRGSTNGPVIAKGSPDSSLLYQKLSTRAMPPPIYGQRVSDGDIATVRAWIANGAKSDIPLGAVDKEIAGQRARYEKEVQPIFNARCIACHGQAKPMAGLDLRSLPLLLKGSTGEPVVVEGRSEKCSHPQGLQP